MRRLVVLLALLITACNEWAVSPESSHPPTASSTDRDLPIDVRPATTIPPGFGPGGRLSPPHDLEPMAIDEATDWAASSQPSAAGRRVVATVAETGYGTFSIEIPDHWTQWWPRAPIEPYLEIVSRKDAGLAAAMRPSLRRGQESEGTAQHRLHALDATVDDLVEMQVTLVAVPKGSTLADHADLIAQQVAVVGATVIDRRRVVTLVGETLRIEVQVPGTSSGFARDVTQLRSLFHDDVNDFMWEVSCIVADDLLPCHRQTCNAIQDSLRVRGPVSP